MRNTAWSHIIIFLSMGGSFIAPEPLKLEYKQLSQPRVSVIEVHLNFYLAASPALLLTSPRPNPPSTTKTHCRM